MKNISEKGGDILFINFSNHPHSKWSDQQIRDAEAYGDIKDISFPNVDAGLTCSDIDTLSEKYINEILSYKPDCVLCQGEFTLAYAVISKLRQKGIKTAAACSERIVAEKINPDGNIERTSVFRFVQFREYI